MKMNKKGVEALPLRYIIIALVAALVIGIALQFTGILRSGVIGSANKINDTLTEKTICELDDDKPTIDFTAADVSNGTNWISVSAEIEDECGIDVVMAYLNKGSTSESIELTMTSGTEVDGTWTGNKTDISTGTWDIVVWAKDKSPTGNDDSKSVEDIIVG